MLFHAFPTHQRRFHFAKRAGWRDTLRSRLARVGSRCAVNRALWFWVMLSVPGLAAAQKQVRILPLGDPGIPAEVMRSATPTAWHGPEQGPVPGLRVFATESTGAVWLGAGGGAARFDPRAEHRWDRWQFFQAPAWLADNAVANIWIDGTTTNGLVYVRTARGVSRLEWSPMLLREKAAALESRIPTRHLRLGLLADAELARPGVVDSVGWTHTDNDGLWTSLYLGAEALRYAATRERLVRERAGLIFRGVLELERVTGNPGFPARTFLAGNATPPPGDREWHRSQDGSRWWKGDTSSDELVGHYFGLGLYHELAAAEPERAMAAALVARITDHILRRGLELIDVDGAPTRWGRWSEKFFETHDGLEERSLHSLQILAFLRVAARMTGDPRYLEAYDGLVERGYARWAQAYGRGGENGKPNFSDDHLAFLSYYMLLRYETAPHLKAAYVESLGRLWNQARLDENPLWNYISIAGGALRPEPQIREASSRVLERIPLHMIKWDQTNSHRIDLAWRPDTDRFGLRQLTLPLSPDERPVLKWNMNPFLADGGVGGLREDDGLYFLLPYWMGRHHGLIR